jgi:hypothetical protein
MAVSVNRKRPDRGGKPLLHVGVVRGQPCRVLSWPCSSVATATPLVNAAFSGLRFEPISGTLWSPVRFDSTPLGLVSFKE